MDYYTSRAENSGPIKTDRKKMRFDVLKKVKKNIGEELKILEDLKSVEEQTSRDDIQLCMFHLGGELYVVAKPFNGKMLIHIREYAMDSKRNVRYPTKRGITLDLEKFKKLSELCYDDVTEHIEEYKTGTPMDYKYHLGSNLYVTLKSGWPNVHIRKWFLPQDETELVPTRKGLALTFEQWSFIKGAMNLMKQLLKDQWDNVTFCELSEDHQNQMGFLTCSKCNPNDYMNY